jgi:predicted RNase H-like nuclease (RuvC/YqgF family)
MNTNETEYIIRKARRTIESLTTMVESLTVQMKEQQKLIEELTNKNDKLCKCGVGKIPAGYSATFDLHGIKHTESECIELEK